MKKFLQLTTLFFLIITASLSYGQPDYCTRTESELIGSTDQYKFDRPTSRRVVQLENREKELIAEDISTKHIQYRLSLSSEDLLCSKYRSNNGIDLVYKVNGSGYYLIHEVKFQKDGGTPALNSYSNRCNQMTKEWISDTILSYLNDKDACIRTTGNILYNALAAGKVIATASVLDAEGNLGFYFIHDHGDWRNTVYHEHFRDNI